MNMIEKAYNQVRSELAEVGLLAEGLYLDCIELCVSDYPWGRISTVRSRGSLEAAPKTVSQRISP